jgi:predicted O-methyltransferase YrrM
MRTNKVGLLLRRPGEVCDRLRNTVHGLTQLRAGRCTIGDVAKTDTIATIVSGLFPDTAQPAAECSRIKSHIDAQHKALRKETQPFGAFHNGTATLGELCYLTCRYLCPQIAVETGVAYGVTSAYILEALADNGRGTLDSIDLPPLARDADGYVGYFIPQELRKRWTLHYGSARRVLPVVLNGAGTIDFFVHDSLHTYSHMKWEFEMALRSLRPGGVLISDDIEGNRAFEETTRHPSVASWVAIRQEGKDAICGALRTRS